MKAKSAPRTSSASAHENVRDGEMTIPFESKLLPAVLLSEGKQVYTKGAFSSENSSATTGKKRGLVYTKNLVFKGKRRKIRIHQSAFKVSVGDPFAQYWCIDFGLLLLFLRIYYPKITVTVAVMKFGQITITVTVLAPAVAPSFPLTPNYCLECHFN